MGLMFSSVKTMEVISKDLNMPPIKNMDDFQVSNNEFDKIAKSEQDPRKAGHMIVIQRILTSKMIGQFKF